VIRFVLRLAAVLALAGAVYLVVLAPRATVAQADLLSKVTLQVGCSSVWSQQTHHAKPAALLLDGKPLISVPEAQSACASASTKIKHYAEGLTAGAVVLGGLSFVRRRRRR
jgi:hypothetical protein